MFFLNIFNVILQLSNRVFFSLFLLFEICKTYKIQVHSLSSRSSYHQINTRTLLKCTPFKMKKIIFQKKLPYFFTSVFIAIHGLAVFYIDIYIICGHFQNRHVSILLSKFALLLRKIELCVCVWEFHVTHSSRAKMVSI